MEHSLLRPHKSSNYPQPHSNSSTPLATNTGPFTIEHLLSVKVDTPEKSDSPQSSSSTISLVTSLRRQTYNFGNSSLMNLTAKNPGKNSRRHSHMPGTASSNSKVHDFDDSIPPTILSSHPQQSLPFSNNPESSSTLSRTTTTENGNTMSPQGLKSSSGYTSHGGQDTKLHTTLPQVETQDNPDPAHLTGDCFDKNPSIKTFHADAPIPSSSSHSYSSQPSDMAPQLTVTVPPIAQPVASISKEPLAPAKESSVHDVTRPSLDTSLASSQPGSRPNIVSRSNLENETISEIPEALNLFPQAPGSPSTTVPTGLLRPNGISELSSPTPSGNTISSSFPDSHYTSISPSQSHHFSDPLGSPASSMIFERSVQDIHSMEINNKIPLHHSNDDFIPPVLDASTEALTNKDVDPELVEVLSLRPTVARTLSFSDSSSPISNALGLSLASPDPPTLSPIGSVSRKDSFVSVYGDSASNFAVALPPNPPFAPKSPSYGTSMSSSALASLAGMSPSRNLQRASIPNFGHKKDGRVLSFCSFADLVNSEHASNVSPSIGGAVVPPSSPGASTVTSPIIPTTQDNLGSPTMSTSPIRSQNSSASIHDSYSNPLFPNRLRTSTSRFSLAPSDAGDFEAAALDITSLGETLRRNSHVITSHS